MLFANPASLRMPTAAEALPGRDEPLPAPPGHFVHGRPIAPTVSGGNLQRGVRPGLLLGGRADVLAARGRLLDGRRLRRRSFTRNPTYEEVCSGRTGHSEVVLVVHDPRVVEFEDLLRVFWESHDPTQGMRQGNDVGTQYRSVIFVDGGERLRAAEASRDAYQPGTDGGRLRADHHGDPRGAALLPRRGVPPAVPGEEPRRLLRPRGDRRRLPAARRGATRLRGGRRPCRRGSCGTVHAPANRPSSR